MNKLNASYQEIKTQITGAQGATSSALGEASQLLSQRQQVEKKQALLKKFNESFILSPDETAALTLTSEPVDDRFFSALQKAKRISQDCEVLLGFEKQTLGLEVMEQTSKQLNLGFQKLYRWVQREFKTLNLENPQLGSSIRRALRVLAERSSLFQNCLDSFAETREHVLSDSFHAALTGSSSNGAPVPSVKPIELAAHDTLRYVGDMLAWAHSAAVGEREALEVLFISDGDEIAKGIQAGRENEVWRLAAEEDEAPAHFDAAAALNELVDRDMSGAARLLRQRVEQVIQTNEEVILAYKLANLLKFYKSTFSRLLSASSSLVEVLGALETEALRQFRSLARDHVATLQGDFQHMPADLRPPDFFTDALEQLSAIMATYETSLTAADDRVADFEPVLAEVFDPFISGCANMAQASKAPSNSIFFLNCLLAARSTLTRYTFTGPHVLQLEEKMSKQRALLVDSQYQFFRNESGLDPLITSLTAVKEQSNKEDLKSLEALQPSQLTHASQTLDNFLPAALMDAVENLHRLQDSKMARDVTEQAAERFCADFERVEEMLMLVDEQQDEDEDGDGQQLRALFPRTSGEIRVLLS